MYAATACVFALTLWSGSALAGPEPLEKQEFYDLMQGKTATFSYRGEPYGSEAYHDGRVVIWRDTQGQCQEGTWHSIADYHCFRYDHMSCWKVFPDEEAGAGHHAVSTDGLKVDFETITDGVFDCQGAPLS